MAVRDRIRDLRRVRAGDLVPHPGNWRVHPRGQQDALRGVLEEVGYADALLARELPDGRLMLVDGHLRRDLDPEQIVPVLVLDVDEHEAKKILLTLDPLAAMAEANAEALDSLLKEVETGSEAVAKMLEELAAGAGIVPPETEPVDAEPQIDRANELQVQWGTESGQLWTIESKTVPGKYHRVLCGDSTKAEDVGRLMGGERASCIFTDPPYGVSLGAKNRFLNSIQPFGRCLENIASDDLTPEQLKITLLPAFVLLRSQVMADDCTLFVTAPQGGELGMMMMMMMTEANLRPRHVLIWKKNQPTFSMGHLDYDYAHEPILLTWGKRHKRPMAGTHRTSVWEIDKPRKSPDHPTMKPIDLYLNAYLNNSDAGDVVADIYAGSGPAIVAAENCGRVAFGMELKPGFTAVILQRATDCGLTPRLAPASAPAAAGGEK